MWQLFERVYESFREFHAFFAVAFDASNGGNTASTISKPCWSSPKSVVTPRISPRPFRLRPGPCSAFSPRPAGMMIRS